MTKLGNSSAGKLTNTFFEQRARITQSIALRKRFIESAYLNQMKSEKELIQSRIDGMTYGCRKGFLAARLRHLNEELSKR
jgi:hypothetical protein